MAEMREILEGMREMHVHNAGVLDNLTRLTNQVMLQQQQQQQQQAQNAQRQGSDFVQKCPRFKRGRDRWADFAAQMNTLRVFYQVNDAVAKMGLWSAIEGSGERMVITSMAPTLPDYVNLTYEQYSEAIGRKFTPASESLQMRAEYLGRKQDRSEDIQSYLNEKHQLFKLAYPDNTPMGEFYREALKGILNVWVRDQMWHEEPDTFERYCERAVYWVQAERTRIEMGDSSSSNMDGLIPVTKNPVRRIDRGEAMEVDHLQKIKVESKEDPDEEGEGCECMMLHEKGMRGVVCYYCQKRGHMLRNCNRKAAGLPRIKEGTPQGMRTEGRGGMMKKKTGFTGKGTNKAKFTRGNPRGNYRRVNDLHNDDEKSDLDEGEEEEYEEEAEEDEKEEPVSFLEEMPL
jgi:hypothetical protein